MLNSVIIVGRLGRDPEVKYTNSGMAVCSFSVAVNRDTKDEVTDWLDVVTFDKTAEYVGKYFTKGRLMSVEGRLQKRSWEDKEGNKRWATEIVANRVKSLERQPERVESTSYTAATVKPTDEAEFSDPFADE